MHVQGIVVILSSDEPPNTLRKVAARYMTLHFWSMRTRLVLGCIDTTKQIQEKIPQQVETATKNERNRKFEKQKAISATNVKVSVEKGKLQVTEDERLSQSVFPEMRCFGRETKRNRDSKY